MQLRLTLAAAIAALACAAPPASAALLARAGGFFYDTELGITWLADANLAKTIGLSASGLTTQAGAQFVASRYLYQNAYTGTVYANWRLPTLGPDVDTFDAAVPGSGGQRPGGFGAIDTGWGTPGDSRIFSELGWMFYANLGGRARCEAVAAEPCQFNPHFGLPNFGAGPNKGPFASLELNGFYWTGSRAVYLSPQHSNVPAYWAFSFDDGYQAPNAPTGGNPNPGGYVWLVHDGDVAAGAPAGVPEPSGWTLLIAGFGAMGAALRRKVSTGSHVA